MRLIDTHTHLYLEQFESDRHSVIASAINKGVDTFLLPNIDRHSIAPMLQLCADFPRNCFPMIGLHPTSVGTDFKQQLQLVEQELEKHPFIGIGEIGLDFYWDTTFKEQQMEALRYQLQLAIKHDLPVAIHTRDAFPEILDEVEQAQNGHLKGVFHCFSGNKEDAIRIMNMGFLMGICGVVTFKKSSLPEVVQSIPMEYLLLETDSPFLAPAPFRGKRNESGYLMHIARKLAEIKDVTIDQIASDTTANAQKLFKI
jgi:TatD DNase family protein